MVKDSRRPSSPARPAPVGQEEDKPSGQARKAPRRKPPAPVAEAPATARNERNERSHAQYPDPEPPPDRVWEDRAG